MAEIAAALASLHDEKGGDFQASTSLTNYREILKDYPELESGTTGEGGCPSYREVARQVERANHTIKRWVDLVSVSFNKRL